MAGGLGRIHMLHAVDINSRNGCVKVRLSMRMEEGWNRTSAQAEE